MMIRSILAASLLALTVSTTASAQDLKLRYCGDEVEKGYGKADIYYTAYTTFRADMLRPYVGARITKLRIGVKHDATGVYVYFKDDARNTANNYKEKITTLSKGWNELTLATPQEIVADKDIAIGYRASFAEADGLGYAPGSFSDGSSVYVNSSSSWESLSGGVFCIEAVVEGDNLPQNEVRIGAVDDQTADFGVDSLTFSGVVYNGGANAVSSFELTYTVDGESAATTFATDMPVNGKAPFSVTLHRTSFGTHPVTFTISQVNGADDPYMDNNTTTARMTFQDPEFRRRVLVEEATGLWCGWCPGAAYVLEEVKKEYGSWFNPVAVHWDDKLAPDTSLPYAYADLYANFTGAPSCMVDRKINTTPTNEMWTIYRNESVPTGAVLTTTCQWNADSTQLTVDADFYMAHDETDAQYNMVFHLLEDEVKGQDDALGEVFPQHNYYARGQSGEASNLPGWIDKAEVTTDYVMMNLAIGAFPSFAGAPVVRGDIVGREHYQYRYTFDVPTHVIHGGKSTHLINKRNLHVTSALIDVKSGYIVNSFDARPEAQTTGIQPVDASFTMSGCRYQLYSADGKLVRQGVMAGSLNDIEVPAHGLYVVKMSKDGLVKTIKIMK